MQRRDWLQGDMGTSQTPAPLYSLAFVPDLLGLRREKRVIHTFPLRKKVELSSFPLEVKLYCGGRIRYIFKSSPQDSDLRVLSWL